MGDITNRLARDDSAVAYSCGTGATPTVFIAVDGAVQITTATIPAMPRKCLSTCGAFLSSGAANPSLSNSGRARRWALVLSFPATAIL